MNPTRSTNFRHNSDSRPACNEDHSAPSVSHSRTEEEKQRRRQEWLRQQERDRQHEKLKQRKILEYERKRAQSLKYTEQKLMHHSRSRSKSDSKSPLHHLYRAKSTSTTSKSSTLFEKLDESTNGAMPLFKGPQGRQISVTELRRIKVDIRRNIPTKGPVIELERDILNPEDVVLKRREGEGCKPIFDREEIKTTIIKPGLEVDEQRTVVAIDGEQSVSNNKSRISKKRSSSLSPIRNRSYSPGYPLSYQSRYNTNSKHHNSKTEYRDHRKNDGSSIEKRREYKAKYTERDINKYNTNRSRSRERDPRSSRSRPFMEERSHRDRYRGRSSDHSHMRRDRDRDRDKSMERRNVAPHYIEPVHVPIYCDFPPRPIVVSPLISFRGQVPPMGRGRHPALIGPIRPFPPRFVPPDMYRLGPPPPNPRYGPF